MTPAPMAASEHAVIVGAGQASAQTIEALRDRGFAGRITLIGDEPVPPYMRPPLSKSFLVDGRAAEHLQYRPDGFYAKHRVRLVLGRRALEIDRRASRVRLDDGEAVAYDRLVLATGSRARMPRFPGADCGAVCCIRTLDDAERLRERLTHARRVVILGGGFIGLETAAVLVKSGRAVTLLAAADRLLPRAAAPSIARFFRDFHTAQGVRIILNTEASEVRERADGSVDVVCADGSVHPADLVVAGIGIVPNMELAGDCGIECDDGILVDERAVTSDPRIAATGDCTRHPNAWADRKLRLETVHNAVEQSKSAAATMMGVSAPYRQVPWVWSDQYRLRLQSVGFADRHDLVVRRGDPAAARFAEFYFLGSRLVGMSCVNRPREFGACRRILNGDTSFSPEQAEDPDVDLDIIAPRRTRIGFDVPWSGTRK